eukprot:Lankesteria_metandrocarpae@DN444_c0_g1_i1.p1
MASYGTSVDGARIEADPVLTSLRQCVSEGLCEAKAMQSRAVSVEVEGRLGVIVDNTTQCRLALPATSETTLIPSRKDFQYSFKPGMTKQQYDRLREVLTERSTATKMKRQNKEKSVDASGAAHRFAFGNTPVTLETRDTFYEITPHLRQKHKIPYGITRIRVTRDAPPANSPPASEGRVLEVIGKRSMSTQNVHSGKDTRPDIEDEEEIDRLDVRFSINLEVHFPNTILDDIRSERIPPTHSRTKNRTTYRIMDIFKVDTTTVTKTPTTQNHYVRQNKASDTVYEVEVEIEACRLAHEFKALHSPQATSYFTVILKDFIGLVRDLTFEMNAFIPGSSTTEEKLRVDIKNCAQPTEAVSLYLNNVCPVVPLIGDYLFRAVAPVQQRQLSIAEQWDAIRVEITAAEAVALQEHEDGLPRLRVMLSKHKIAVAPSQHGGGGGRGGYGRGRGRW